MARRDDERALRWSCQAWMHAERHEDRRKHAIDATRIANLIEADAAAVAELSLIDLDSAQEILRIGGESAGVLVEKMFRRWLAGDADGALESLSDDVEIVTSTGDALHGLPALRARMSENVERPPFDLALEFIEEHDGAVLVAATASVLGEGGRDVSQHRPAWVCDVADHRVVRVTTHLDWDAAHEAFDLAA